MSKLEEARQVLQSLDVPPAQQNEMCCYTLLALASLTENGSWEKSKNEWIGIHEIMRFVEKAYKKTYAENTRESIRKNALHHFRNAAFIEDNAVATNSPNYRYRLTPEFLALVRHFGKRTWKSHVSCFLSSHGSLRETYASRKQRQKMPVNINGQDLTLSPGKHNQLQKQILEQFAPRFAPHAECLYVGDTTEKDLLKNTAKLRELGFAITLHDKMPDIVLYRPDKHWLYFIESVTSVGPIDPKRLLELQAMTRSVTAGKIYVTAFPDLKTFKKFAHMLAWDTEVWIAELPEHMIHFNGDMFMGPRE